ncbi:uncharacterized protein PAC_17859 [Phialocephala subalpina]|uniref:Uncharacterized protein n=1 Tax=Phialocephala subalpina TaxID=576137 RepID=A0A1L7XSE7_9HELO|nr:uncharacterized protein PAC_17859 [Phialocephala subalpina]
MRILFPPPTLPTPASTPREEPDTDGQADQHKNAAKQGLSQRGRALHNAYVEDGDDPSVEQTSDDPQRSAHLDDARQEKQPSEPAVTSSILHPLDTPQHASSKRKQHFEDSSALKRAHIELADAIEAYLTSTNLYSNATALREELNICDSLDAAISKKYEGAIREETDDRYAIRERQQTDNNFLSSSHLPSLN